MLASVVKVAFEGVDARRVDVQVHQLPSGDQSSFTIVGLADKAVAESRERVRGAFAGIGLSLPAKRIIVNMAPADLPKEGSHFDLPIALALLASMGVIPPDMLSGWAAVGELGLDGRIAPVGGSIAVMRPSRTTTRAGRTVPVTTSATRCSSSRSVTGMQGSRDSAASFGIGHLPHDVDRQAVPRSSGGDPDDGIHADRQRRGCHIPSLRQVRDVPCESAHRGEPAQESRTQQVLAPAQAMRDAERHAAGITGRQAREQDADRRGPHHVHGQVRTPDRPACGLEPRLDRCTCRAAERAADHGRHREHPRRERRRVRMRRCVAWHAHAPPPNAARTASAPSHASAGDPARVTAQSAAACPRSPRHQSWTTSIANAE